MVKKVLCSVVFSYATIMALTEPSTKSHQTAAPDFKNVTRIVVNEPRVEILVPRDEVMPVVWTEASVADGVIATQSKVHGRGPAAFENDWFTLKKAWAKIRSGKKTETSKRNSTEITFARDEKCHARWEESHEPDKSYKYKRLLHVHCGKYKRMLVVAEDKYSVELDHAGWMPDDGEVQQLYKDFPQEYTHDDVAKKYESLEAPLGGDRSSQMLDSISSNIQQRE